MSLIFSLLLSSLMLEQQHIQFSNHCVSLCLGQSLACQLTGPLGLLNCQKHNVGEVTLFYWKTLSNWAVVLGCFYSILSSSRRPSSMLISQRGDVASLAALWLAQTISISS